MNNAINILSLIDDRSRDLYELITSKFEVAFESSFNGEYSVYRIDKQMTFYIPIDHYCVDSFSHELLHGYIDCFEIYLGSNFKNTMWQSNILRILFDNQLAEHLTNSISHTLMLPLYLDRGFDRTKFLLDYHTFKAEAGFINRIGKNYKQGNRYNLLAVRNFIGKFFAFKCDPNPTFDYEDELGQLRKIDLQLYRIVENYFLQWKDYDFTDDEFSDYRIINSDFYANLKPWMNGKKFI
ncbi:hypothetical protein [Pedobacter nyackensis]|uniref:hypothetical protein n=1 Tax=Pedobacter nyackensis TaxID=475255 RepID=UPI002930902F|nr:hypothetical protein [Pedobacter nyackensis]